MFSYLIRKASSKLIHSPSSSASSSVSMSYSRSFITTSSVNFKLLTTSCKTTAISLPLPVAKASSKLIHSPLSSAIVKTSSSSEITSSSRSFISTSPVNFKLLTTARKITTISLPPVAKPLVIASSTSAISLASSSTSAANSLSRSGLLSSSSLGSLHSYLIFAKCYKSFPKLRKPKVQKPGEAMDVMTLDAHYEAAKPVPKTAPAADASVIEIKYAACPNSNLNSKAPNFRVHNLCAGFIQDNKVIHIIDLPAKAKHPPPDRLAYASKVITSDLAATGINKEDVKKIWWNDGGEDIETFWSKRFLKHFQFSTEEAGHNIKDYASKIFKFGKEVVEGDGKKVSLGEFLEIKGFEVGKYHEVSALLPVLKEYFGVDAYPTFVGQGKHPVLFEVGELRLRHTEDRIDHPMAKLVPQGKFLMRKI